MPTDVRLSLVILAVDDLARAAKFYREAFGWPQNVDEPVYAEFAIGGGQRLGLYRRDCFGRWVGQMPKAVPLGEVAGVELYFMADDLAGAMTRLVTAGGKIVGPLRQRDWGDEAAYFTDPEGNVIVLARPNAAPE